MDGKKQIQGQLIAMVAVGLALTVFAAVTKNTVLAIIIFVAQGTLGSMLNVKFRNEVFREISEMDEGLYNDLLHTVDISPKTAEKEGRPYPEAIAAMLGECMRVQAVNKWMPFLEAALFFVLQIVLFANI